MNWGDWILWGFVATMVLTTIMDGTQRLGITRINIPFILGTILTPDRDRAKLYGIGIHVLNGLAFAFIYAAAFHSWGGATWWRGAIVGFVHASFVLVVVLPALPGLHHRMASEQHGPIAERQLEPPGFLGLHYGYRTPLSVVVAHVVYGVILGSFYRVS